MTAKELDDLIKQHSQQVAQRGKSHLSLRCRTTEREQRRPRPRHLESDLQISCVRWFRLQYPSLSSVLFAVPNGGQRNLRTAQILKAEGALAGVADLILLTPRGSYGALCIEMKHGRGKQSDHQRAWQAQAERAGNKYVVVRSREEFEQVVQEYLSD